MDSSRVFALKKNSSIGRLALGLCRYPGYIKNWYVDRLGGPGDEKANGWVLAEVICMTLSLLTLVLMAVSGVLRLAGTTFSPWVSTWLLPVLLAGSVGYLTNLVAVTMLFRPYGPEDDHPLSIMPFWQQGLVVQHRDTLAKSIGRQVSEDMLTPQVIADEIRKMLEGALQDADLRNELREVLGPAVREKLPIVIEKLRPGIMQFLCEMISQGFNKESLIALYDEVLVPYLEDNQSRDRMIRQILSFLRKQVPDLIKLLQKALEDYKGSGTARRLAVWVAEASGLLDWDDVAKVISKKVGQRETRKLLVARIGEMVSDLRIQLGDSSKVDEFKNRAMNFVVSIVQKHLQEKLPEVGHRVAEDENFWNWLTEEGLPLMQPYVVQWLEERGPAVIGEKFDVAGRVTHAINNMEIREFHEKINDISGRHLVQIQVLGYALGLLAGTCLLCV